jgi:hypothetical protein
MKTITTFLVAVIGVLITILFIAEILATSFLDDHFICHKLFTILECLIFTFIIGCALLLINRSSKDWPRDKHHS